MTTRLLAFALASLVAAAAAAQHFHHRVTTDPDDKLRVSVCDLTRYVEPALDPSQQGVPWNVTPTKNREAVLAHFNQGMTLIYGFNYEGALHNFRRAVLLDDDFVMGWWGMALAAGPNINITPGNLCKAKAREWSENAWNRAKEQKAKDTLPTVEYDLADALQQRYAGGTTHAQEYANAMKVVWDKQLRVPQPEPNVGALYAESLMDLHPWDLYDNDRKQKEWTQPVLDALVISLGHFPDALGANHYYIHAVEAGMNPGLALDSARRLDTAVKGSGHLLHMPSHTYFLTGRYADAVAANTRAIEIDGTQFDVDCQGTYGTYIKNLSCQPLYFGHYYTHNLFFRAVAEAFSGRSIAAIADARATHVHAARFLPNEPGLQRYMTAPYLLYAALGAWEEIGREEEPDCTPPPPFEFNSGCHIAKAAWHWARGMAYTTRPKNLDTARKELGEFDRERKLIPDVPYTWGNNKAGPVLAIAEKVLLARIAWADNKRGEAIDRLKEAVVLEHALQYDEPPQWIFPVRQSLGGAYLVLGGKPNAALALSAFDGDLALHPKNGRSLFGKWKALEILERTQEAKDAETAYREAWAGADPREKELKVEYLWLLGMPAAPSGEGPPAPGP